jgi:hypothetical protein
VPLIAEAGGTGEAGRRLPLFLRRAVWTFFPTLVCGVGLLAFNWMRFGSATEFGIHYQLAGERVMKIHAITIRNLIPHMREYLFNPGLWQTYFPFFGAQSGKPYGLIRYNPWVWLSIAAFLPLTGAGIVERSKLRVFTLTAVVASIANLALLSCFYGATPRYPGDFANAGLIVAGIGALALAQRAAVAGRAACASMGFVAVALISLAFGLAVYVNWFPAGDTFLRLARAANWPVYLWERAHGTEFGGLRLDVRLPVSPTTLPEPLLETGRQGDQRDWVQIDYPAPKRARLSLFHAGTGLFQGSDFPIPADRRIVVEVRCGSLLPPFGHPVFSGWTREEFDAARRDMQLKVNGVEVLRAAFDCYDSSPESLAIGRLKWFSGGMDQTFTGDILGVRTLPLIRPEKKAPLFKVAAPIQLKLYLHSGRSDGADPILVTGHGIQSDFIYCMYDGINRVKFALDHWGSGGPISESVPFNPLVPHTLTVWMGSMTGATTGRLVVLFDGRALLNVEQVFYPSSPESIILGYNQYGSTTAGQEFTGRIVDVRQVGTDTLPPMVSDGAYGEVEMSAVMPLGALGTAEPLVVTGEAGAGDFIYVSYLDPNHVSVGFDHWGVGGLMGQPFELDYGQTHRIAITMGSLYPPGTGSKWQGLVRVKIDGNTALEGKFRCYPSKSDQIRIGKNPIGGSTCGPAFTGQILSVERAPEPRE